MIRIVEKNERVAFNKVAGHPLQSWEWGEFRLKTGIDVVRLGRYVKDKLTETALVTFHPVPFTSYSIGYFPKGKIPSGELIRKLTELGDQKNAILIKLEPDIEKKDFHAGVDVVKHLLPSPHPLFTRYTFRLDLTASEDLLLSAMHPKTRYNIRLSQKKGIRIIEDNSPEAFETYLQLLKETTIRQKFFAHTEKYHRLMWETMHPTGIARLLLAKHGGGEDEKVLVAWIVFLFNGVLYYPYGASSLQLRQFMPSNLMMWEVIRYGKKHGANLFDMWGALDPDPDPKDPWYGFHKFKEGYGAKLTEFAGSFDLTAKPLTYRLFNGLQQLREIYLKLKASLR
ncbi:MAG: femAB [Candidatus Gottesmanbacteria bacterium GW2011_GWA2_43_14]|uniref:FemAB n=1 Tax=Candidatus Gottesmanbacteria bacterium GW2011_GWA2_43_14 TaxID=1618443 RepID=A0A0G1GHF8_9BACT|nr:MAG: femAB [Candidatus Gottesmanbacteria bacterium GW2011_GWA2_43_14]